MVEVLEVSVVALMMVQMVVITPSEQAMAEEAEAVTILVLVEMEARVDSLEAEVAVVVPITKVVRLLQVAQEEMASVGFGHIR